ncbi:MAG TPA: hypothetical protein DIV40_00050 [Clostridiales bacterium]|jgi:diguanylate cyclase (GGDEF)-like protein/PAS domain S-box-containing protein/putative nucleotidyltransferase with HDIG domain|nr:hypothetical protein [Clostridiales bacterium]
MKKVLILVIAILLYSMTVSYAHTGDIDLYESILINVLIIAIILLMATGLIIIKSLKKLKAQKNEISINNELIKTYIDANNSLIYLKDENLNYVFVNKAVMEFFDKSQDEIVGHNIYDIAEIDYADMSNKLDLEVLEKGTIITAEKKWREKVLKSTKFPVKQANGNYGVGAYIEDVTEAYRNKKMEEKRLISNQILVDVMSRKFESTQEQFDYALNESLKLTESKFGYIYLYNEEKQEFILNSWSKDVMDECAIIEKLTKYQLENVGLWGEVVRNRKPIIVNDFQLPNKLKKGYPEGHVNITKFMSIPVLIDEKIVAVVGVANKEYDYDDNDVYELITLMNGIWNAKERREALINYKAERNKFLQTLISIGDGVIVVDLAGKVTMLNNVAERLTGWTYKEAKGKHYKEVFVLSHENSKAVINDPIGDVLKTDTVQELGNHAILTSKQGVRYCLEDSAAPIKDYKGNTYGVVLVFRDVTEKKEQRDKIEYLSVHDPLTGLYNRIFLGEELKRLDTKRNLPISIIFGDMNGLKLTNDIFGHAAGDLLLKKAAKVFRQVLRADDIIARVGGDEFTILLPNTNEEKAKEIIDRIKIQFSKEKVKAIKGSISMGCDTKHSADENIFLKMSNAEKRMYSVKTLDRENVKTTTIEAIIDTLHRNSQREKEHSKNVSVYCENMGKAMGLSDVKNRRLKEAGYLHDIGKITLSHRLINNNGKLSDQELHEMKQHPVAGYRILNSFDGTLDLAETILSHHEKWDGSGYPKGLKEKEIPLLARIIYVAGSYDEMTNKYSKAPLNSDEAVIELIKAAGKKFDPEIVELFVKMIHGN